jgi:signal peptidase I
MESNPTSKAADKPAAKQTANGSVARTVRETVESIVIAFVLAFLFRTFEAEAFVIPTGSMAPTLQGRHKDVVCPECEYPYRVGVQADRDDRNAELMVSWSVCPMCRHKLDIADKLPEEPRKLQTFEGDRILVNKFSYESSDPRRWDVVVFKYPEDAKTNYIKRLIGLPGESIYIGHPGTGFDLPGQGTGDIYVSTDGGKTRTIARKDTPEKLVAMLQDVYDNDYVAASLLNSGWPSRWQGEGAREGGWAAEDDTRAFAIEGKQEGEIWLRYHHLLPRLQTRDVSLDGTRYLSSDFWEDAAKAKPSEYLITDFYAYNTGDYHPEHDNPRVKNGLNWVGDLAVECDVEFRAGTGEIVLELVKGGATFQARLDLASGDARLVIPGSDDYKPTAKDVIDAPGTHQIRFANIDEQLWLFVDDELVEFDSPTSYDPPDNYVPIVDPRRSHVGASDLLPVGIASAGADVRVSHLRVKRDVFYTREDQHNAVYEVHLTRDPADRNKDQFFMLGDNSPSSKDGRMWDSVKYVERRLLIGKAVYIYWPHGIPASFSFPVNVFGSRKYVPFWPNFSQMHRIR